jgi:hypothetical protein
MFHTSFAGFYLNALYAYGEGYTGAVRTTAVFLRTGLQLITFRCKKLEQRVPIGFRCRAVHVEGHSVGRQKAVLFGFSTVPPENESRPFTSTPVLSYISRTILPFDAT